MPSARRLDFTDHRRELDQNRYIYAVVSRRARGLSIGVNLNPDKVCNFDCPYCQVDRSGPKPDGTVIVGDLSRELARLLDLAAGDLWSAPPFDTVDPALRRVADIAFAGDGEPTSPPEFAAAAHEARRLIDRAHPPAARPPLRLLTNSTLLHRAAVIEALPCFDELWCKLDAGTEAYFQRVDGTTFPFARVLKNLEQTARARPITVQSMFLSLGGLGPDDAEIDAWAGRLRHILDAGGQLAQIQVYTVARRPASPEVAPLPRARLEEIAARAPAGVPVDVQG